MRIDVNACDCTLGIGGGVGVGVGGGATDTVRESALKVDSGRNIPCLTGESNLCRPVSYTHLTLPTRRTV